MTTIFDPVDLAGLKLPNRVVMAPMTRSRAGRGATATPLDAKYYAQRASAGLIITGGIQISAVGQGYPNTPGMHSEEQTQSWRQVTEAVHAAGGRIFAQIVHSGRVGHPDNNGGLRPVAPSEISAPGMLFTPHGPRPMPIPYALTESEIDATIADFASAAGNAIDAGFDGVEIHAGNGYLIHQFLSPAANQRDDAWGATRAGRLRFAREVAAAVTERVGGHRTGVRISPGNPFNGMVEPDARDVYEDLARSLDNLGIAYLHLLESDGAQDLTTMLRKTYSGAVILNPATAPAHTGMESLPLIADAAADLISFGALFLANPDLPARLAVGGPFNSPDPATFYGGGEAGYVDYPSLPPTLPFAN